MPPTDETESQAGQTIALDEKRQDEAPALEEVPQVNIESEVQPAAPLDLEARIAVGRAALSAWILRFRESLNRPKSRTWQSAQEEAEKKLGTEAEAAAESNIQDFNPPIPSIELITIVPADF